MRLQLAIITCVVFSSFCSVVLAGEVDLREDITSLSSVDLKRKDEAAKRILAHCNRNPISVIKELDSLMRDKMPENEDDALAILISISRVIRICGESKNEVFALPITGVISITEDSIIKHACLYALGMIKAKVSLPIVRKQILSPDEGVRANAVWCLIEMGDKEFIVSNPELLADPNLRVQWYAAKIFSELQKKDDSLTMDFSRPFEKLSEDEMEKLRALCRRLREGLQSAPKF